MLRCGQLADRDPDAGVDLGRPGGLEDDVVHAPVGGDDRQAALGDDQEHRLVGPGGADQPAQVARLGQLAAAVDHQQVVVGRLEQGASLGGQDLDLVAEEREPRQHVRGGLQRLGEQQHGAHGTSQRWLSLSKLRWSSLSTPPPPLLVAALLRWGRISNVSAAPDQMTHVGYVTLRYWASAQGRCRHRFRRPGGGRSGLAGRASSGVRGRPTRTRRASPRCSRAAR